jgi:hypothetical protein
MPRSVYHEVKEDAGRLRRFLVAYNPEAAKVGDYRMGNGVSFLVSGVAALLRMLPDVPCTCSPGVVAFGRHRPTCARLAAVEFENIFFQRWGLTRHTSGGTVPPELRRLQDEAARDRSVVLAFPGSRRSAG